MYYNKKILITSFAVFITAIIFLIILNSLWRLDLSKDNINWGVTFSQQYAKDELGLNWQETYLAILDDLDIDNIRLSAYWNHNEPQPNEFNFTDLDWQIEQAKARNINIILAVGRRLPRWPECHDPGWIKDMEKNQLEEKQLNFIKTIIERYDNNPSITIWQIENEPFLGVFGECPVLDKNLFQKELDLARSLTSKPIMITDSGELSTWLKAGKQKPEILGSTLYRIVYSPRFGYWQYPLPPVFYAFKSWWIKKFFNVDNVIIAELQAEAWHKEDKNLKQMTQTENNESLSPKQLQKNIDYARQAGFDTIYLWGAEWWYFLLTDRGDDSYWSIAKDLWRE